MCSGEATRTNKNETQDKDFIQVSGTNIIPIILKFNQKLIKNWDDVWKINKLIHFSPSLTENTQKLLYSC